jgi:hypothetical protein
LAFYIVESIINPCFRELERVLGDNISISSHTI